MSENINNNQSDNKTNDKELPPSSSAASDSDSASDSALPPWPGFNGEVVKQTVNSVCISWPLHEGAVVYKIEKFHRRRGWEKVGWCSESPAWIGQLDENFGYRFRILALRIAAAGTHYEPLAVSPDVFGCTEAPLPTTSCLYRAVRKGQQFLVKRMLRRRPSLIDYPGPNGFLPLANAIVQGEMCIIDVLLSAGCSVDVGNPRNGRTPLHLAFYHGHLPSARILVNKKAQLEAIDCNGMTPSHCAVDGNQLDMLKFALESGANLEATDACGWTLLMRAVVMDADIELVKLLVAHGANLSVVDGVGQSCTELARLYRRADVSEYFDKVHKFRAAKAEEAQQAQQLVQQEEAALKQEVSLKEENA